MSLQVQLLIICAPLSFFLLHPHITEMWGPSPGARVSGGSEVTLRIMKRSIVVSSSQPQLSQSSQIKIKVFLGQVPPSVTSSSWPRVYPYLWVRRGEVTLPGPFPQCSPLLLWRKGHGYTETLWTWHTCHLGVQCQVQRPALIFWAFCTCTWVSKAIRSAWRESFTLHSHFETA